MSFTQYQGREYERANDTRTLKVMYAGTREEMDELGENPPDEGGYNFVSARISQKSPSLWQCEIQYTAAADGITITSPEENEYGKKSCQVHGSMLSIPLESHKDYRTNWNYYLASKPGVTTVPTWWKTATDPLLTGEDAANYAWIKSTGEVPTDPKTGKRWNLLKDPQKPGMDHYDFATYSITETARYHTPAQAGEMIRGCLNRIGKPCETFGLDSGDWKCDACDISWNGRNWIATRTWTLSGGEDGWDKEIYQPVSDGKKNKEKDGKK